MHVQNLPEQVWISRLPESWSDPSFLFPFILFKILLSAPHFSLPAVTDYVYILSSTSLLMLFYLPDILPFSKPPSALQCSSIYFNPAYWNSSSIFKVNSRVISFTQSSTVTPTGSNLFPTEILQDLIYLRFSDKHLAHVYLMYTFSRHCLWQ